MSYLKTIWVAVIFNMIILSYIQLTIMSTSSSDLVNNHFSNETLLVIAHPDDEVMFFGPLIINLYENKKSLHILCLSNGGSDGQGDVRSKELKSVIESLSPYVELKLLVDRRLVDGLSTNWEVDVIYDHVKNYIDSMTSLKTVVTFDTIGVSGHPNHLSINKAIRSLSLSNHGKMKYYYLTSVSMLRKYISFIDALIVRLSGILTTTNEKESRLTLAINFSQNSRLRELLALHNSQMVWFRQLYLLFSRYMFINELTC